MTTFNTSGFIKIFEAMHEISVTGCIVLLLCTESV